MTQQSGNVSKLSKGMKDLLHAVVLICAVPLLFYGGYVLLTRTAKTTTEPPSSILDGTRERLTPLVENVFPPSSPPPGNAWIVEIQRLKTRLASTTPNGPASVARINEVNDRLETLLKHCRERNRELPDRVDPKTPLGQALHRLTESMGAIQQPIAPKETLATDWLSEFAMSEQARIKKRNATIQQQINNRTLPVTDRSLNSRQRCIRRRSTTQFDGYRQD